jgi:hypothetical protein
MLLETSNHWIAHVQGHHTQSRHRVLDRTHADSRSRRPSIVPGEPKPPVLDYCQIHGRLRTGPSLSDSSRNVTLMPQRSLTMRCGSRVMIVVVVARRDTDRCGYGSWPGKRPSPSWTFNEGTARNSDSISSSQTLLRDFPTLVVDIIVTQTLFSFAGPIQCVKAGWVGSWQLRQRP